MMSSQFASTSHYRLQ